MKGTKYILLAIIFISITVGLIACSHEESKNNGKENSDITDFSDLSQLREWAKDNKWQTEWFVDGENSQKKISIDAEITVPEVDSMSVVEVQYLVSSGEDKEEVISGLMDHREVYYYDETRKTKEMWQRDIDVELNQKIKNTEYFMETTGSKMEKEEYEKSLEELKDLKNEWEEKMKAAPQEMIKVGEYNSALNYGQEQYYGEIDNRPYIVSVSHGNDDRMKNEYISIDAYDYFNCIPERLKEAFQVDYHAEADYSADGFDDAKKHAEYTELLNKKNQSEMSIDEAKGLVGRYLEKIGVPNAVCVKESDLVWEGMVPGGNNSFEKDYVKDGYLLRYTFGIHGDSIWSFGVESDYQVYYDLPAVETPDIFSMDTSVYVAVNDKGIINMSIYNPLKIIDVTGNVTLIPVNSVFDIMKDYLDKHNDKFISAYGALNTMELTYFRVTNKSETNRYSYIPVWKLYSSGTAVRDGFEYKSGFNEILMNAIDGTVIDVVGEFTGKAENAE